MKKLTIIISFAVLLFSEQISLAQTPPSKQWDAQYGASSYEYFPTARQTSDGGYIVGGWSGSGISGDKTEASRGSDDYWIVKSDGNGVKEWDKTFGGSTYDQLYSISQTSDGGYVLGGESNSGISGDKTQASQGTFDYWIVKTDANGIKQWDATFGGSNIDYLYSVQQTSDGGYILGGASGSGISGNKTQASQGGFDYWIVKTDGNGVKQWDATFGGSANDELYCVQQTSDGGYILGGFSYSGISSDKTQASQGQSDYWIVKTDANGVKQWDERFGGSDYDFLSSVQETSDGGYILGGESSSGIGGDKTQASQGGTDYWMVKTDANGVKQWDARFGGNANEGVGVLQQTFDGGYILGGWSLSGISGDKTQESQGSGDYWIVKTDGNGIKKWDERFGGSYEEHLNSLQQTSDGGYILGGWSDSDSTGDKTQVSEGFDYWIVKVAPDCTTPTAKITALGSLDICTTGFVKLKASAGNGYTYQWVKGNTNIAGATSKTYKATTPGNYKVKISTGPSCSATSKKTVVYTSCKLDEEPELTSSLRIFPNPTSGNFTLNLNLDDDETSPTQVQLVSMLGQIVYKQTLQLVNGDLQQEIQLNNVAGGMYLVKVIINDKVYTAQINYQK